MLLKNITLKWGLVLATTLSSQISLAWKLGDPIGIIISDGAKDIEKGAQNLGKAAADLVTLGEEGRRRDEENAQHEKQVVEEKKRAAEALKQEKIKNIEIRVIDKRKLTNVINENLGIFQTIEHFLKGNIKSINDELKIYGAQSLQFATQKNMLFRQFKELQDWIQKNQANFQKTLPDGSNFQNNFNNKITTYLNQINNIPQDLNPENFDSIVDSALEAGFNLLAELTQHIDLLHGQKVQNELEISILIEEQNQINSN